MNSIIEKTSIIKKLDSLMAEGKSVPYRIGAVTKLLSESHPPFFKSTYNQQQAIKGYTETEN